MVLCILPTDVAATDGGRHRPNNGVWVSLMFINSELVTCLGGLQAIYVKQLILTKLCQTTWDYCNTRNIKAVLNPDETDKREDFD